MKLQGKRIVVTGGGSGIGAAMVRRFADEGAAQVVVVDRDLASAMKVADGVNQRHADVATAMQVDVASPGAVERLVEEVESTQGAIDLFCSNAGATLAGGPELPDAAWRQVLDVNLMAHVQAARALLPRMLARGGGYLLQTASAAGLLSQFDAPYAVSKHAAVAFAEWLSIGYGDRGIKVSCLCPGAVDTPLLQAETATRRNLMSHGLMDADAVAAVVVQALDEERFLVLTHDFVREQVQRKAGDVDRWIRGMRRLHAQAGG